MAPANGIASHSRRFHLAMALVLGAMLLASGLVEPVAGASLCLFRRVTGLPCMTCGLTRAFHALLTGHWHEALVLHPLSLPILALTVFHLGVATLGALGRARREPRLHNELMYAVLALLLVVWLFRLFTGGLSVL